MTAGLGTRVLVCTGGRPERHQTLLDALSLPFTVVPVSGEPTVDVARSAVAIARDFARRRGAGDRWRQRARPRQGDGGTARERRGPARLPRGHRRRAPAHRARAADDRGTDDIGDRVGGDGERRARVPAALRQGEPAGPEHAARDRRGRRGPRPSIVRRRSPQPAGWTPSRSVSSRSCRRLRRRSPTGWRCRDCGGPRRACAAPTPTARIAPPARTWPSAAWSAGWRWPTPSSVRCTGSPGCWAG